MIRKKFASNSRHTKAELDDFSSIDLGEQVKIRFSVLVIIIERLKSIAHGFNMELLWITLSVWRSKVLITEFSLCILHRQAQFVGWTCSPKSVLHQFGTSLSHQLLLEPSWAANSSTCCIRICSLCLVFRFLCGVPALSLAFSIRLSGHLALHLNITDELFLGLV